MREYSTIRPIRHISFKSFQCLLKSSLIVEYSRMKVPSLSSGCEIAQFFVRHTDPTAHLICTGTGADGERRWPKKQAELD